MPPARTTRNRVASGPRRTEHLVDLSQYSSRGGRHRSPNRRIGRSPSSRDVVVDARGPRELRHARPEPGFDKHGPRVAQVQEQARAHRARRALPCHASRALVVEASGSFHGTRISTGCSSHGQRMSSARWTSAHAASPVVDCGSDGVRREWPRCGRHARRDDRAVEISIESTGRSRRVRAQTDDLAGRHPCRLMVRDPGEPRSGPSLGREAGGSSPVDSLMRGLRPITDRSRLDAEHAAEPVRWLAAKGRREVACLRAIRKNWTAMFLTVDAARFAIVSLPPLCHGNVSPLWRACRQSRTKRSKSFALLTSWPSSCSA